MARLNIPPLTRTCLLICTCLSILTAALRYRAWMNEQSQTDDSGVSEGHGQFFTVPYLTVVPALSIVYPWTFVTSSLIESNVRGESTLLIIDGVRAIDVRLTGRGGACNRFLRWRSIWRHSFTVGSIWSEPGGPPSSGNSCWSCRFCPTSSRSWSIPPGSPSRGTFSDRTALPVRPFPSPRLR